MKALLLLSVAVVLVKGLPQYDKPKDPQGFFQYVNVPGHKEYEFGWKRGNPHHFISRFEQLKDHSFRTRVKWHDKKDGYGEHYWEYNHGPKYDDKHHDGYKEPVHHGYKAPEHHGFGHDDHHGYKAPHDPYKHKHPYGKELPEIRIDDTVAHHSNPSLFVDESQALLDIPKYE